MCACACVCARVCVYARASILVRACVLVCVRVSVCACVCLCVCVCVVVVYECYFIKIQIRAQRSVPEWAALTSKFHAHFLRTLIVSYLQF